MCHQPTQDTPLPPGSSARRSPLRGIVDEMATWNHKRIRQQKEKLRVSLPYSAPFAVSQLSFAFWFSCTYIHHLACSQLLLLPLGVWWVAAIGRWKEDHVGHEDNKR